MSLRDDVEAGLVALNATRREPLALDAEGACEIVLRIPPTVVKLAGEKLAIRLEMAPGDRAFTLRAPIASSSRELPVEVLDAMVGDQLTAARVGGASYTYEPELGVVYAVYHWIVPTITADQLGELIRAFSGAAFRLLERMGSIARRVPGITTINDVEGGRGVSRISGHYQITRRALFELRREDPQDVFIRDFQNAGVAGALSDDDLGRVFFLDRRHIEAVATIGFDQEHVAPKAMVFMLPSSPFVTTMCDAVTDLADGAVCKDLEDIVDGAHWSPSRQAQAGHFMRAPADRPQDAYTAALLWIRRNVDDASAAMSAAYGTLALGPTDLHGHRHGRNLPVPGSGRLTGGRAAKFLGRAVHCVQDSFSSSHVQRGRGTERAPGNIEDIFVYTQQDPKVHEIADREWMVKRRPDQTLGGNSPRPARLSHTGVEAVNATKALISLTVWAAAHRKAEIEMTERWGHFRAQWLACAPSFGV